MAEKLRIKFDAERVLDLISVDEYILLEQGKVEAIKRVLGKFVLGANGDYLPPEEGMDRLGRQPLRELLRLNEMLVGAAKESAAPLPSDEDSGML